jgi:hypothetical protein
MSDMIDVKQKKEKCTEGAVNKKNTFLNKRCHGLCYHHLHQQFICKQHQ